MQNKSLHQGEYDPILQSPDEFLVFPLISNFNDIYYLFYWESKTYFRLHLHIKHCMHDAHT